MKNYVEILTTRKLFTNRETLTYDLPKELSEKIKLGALVKIPLRNSTTKGIVLSKHKRPPNFATKAILGLAEEIKISTWQIELMQWISNYYYCPLSKILPSFIPKKLLSNTKRRKTKPTTNNLLLNTPFNHKLTQAQQQIINKVCESNKSHFLLHGVTGAGKTEIYLQLANNFTKQNKQVVILVPEIALTPQTVRYFEDSFPNELSVIHSKLSEGEKIKAWEDIHSKKSKVIIGSRSTLFAPFQSIGLIIIDEEHDFSYKQDQSPRYHARDLAMKISQLTNCKVVLGSATPSIESYYKAQSGIYQLLELTERINKKPLPTIKLIDLRQEAQKKNYSIFSDELRDKIEYKLKQKEQILLFLNKRGSSSSITCRDCGHTIQCHKCDLPITFHQKPSFQAQSALLCHHCGIVKPKPIQCPNCKSIHLQFYGAGTQKVESELNELFPSARILRADKDTTSTKHGFEEIYKKFRNHEADILIGTQMISKGLHLPKVNLVGVMLADIGAHMPDFRAQERTFQLLTQVAGRSGRKSGQGEVIIQTYNPDNEIMQLAKQQDFINFYNYELPTRQEFPYPPFSKLIKLTFKHSDPKEALKTSQQTKKTLDQLNTKLEHNKQARISLYPAMIHKRNENYRWCILINSTTPKDLINLAKKEISNWTIDVDPISIG